MKYISFEEASKMAKAVIEYGHRIGKPRFSFAVVDSGGHLIYFMRMPGGKFATVKPAIDKAYSAIAMKKPTSLLTYFKVGEFAEGFQLSQPRILPIPGGMPIVHKGEFVGAVGASGGHPQEDEQACIEALKAVGYPTEKEKIQVGYIPPEK
jgi:uncharacterized protein GlcG (DUF336 family)